MVTITILINITFFSKKCCFLMTSNCVKINMYFLKMFNFFKLWVYTIKLISLYSGRFTKHIVQPLFYEFIYFIQVYKNHKFNNIIFTVQKDGPRLSGDKPFVPPKNILH